MASPLFHLKVAERVYEAMAEPTIRRNFGEFCLGAIAPHINLTRPDLNEETTHLVEEDQAGTHFTQRTAIAIASPVRWLTRPVSTFSRQDRAFALGYLCHLATDEIFDPLAERFIGEALDYDAALADVWETYIDTVAAAAIHDPNLMLNVLREAHIPDLLPFARPQTIETLRWILLPYIADKGGPNAMATLMRAAGCTNNDITGRLAMHTRMWRMVATASSQFEFEHVLELAVERSLMVIDQFLVESDAI